MSLRWLLVYGYVIVLFVVAPWLPDLIKWAGSIWSGEAVKNIVLIFEMVLGALLLILAGGLFFLNKMRFLEFSLIAACIIGVSYIAFCLTKNPYELTHLMEYAILVVLVFVALRESLGKSMSERKVYLLAGGIAFAVSCMDELFQGILPTRVFAWNDFWLNGLGCVLGMVVVWGTGDRQNIFQQKGTKITK